MYDLTEYSNNYAKTSWQNYTDEPDDIVMTNSFKFKVRITGKSLKLVMQKMLK